jgi:hypothetical protein
LPEARSSFQLAESCDTRVIGEENDRSPWSRAEGGPLFKGEGEREKNSQEPTTKRETLSMN